jgi:hypothetical protein
MSEDPGSSSSTPPPSLTIPLTPEDEKGHSSGGSRNGCLIAALVAVVGLCFLGVAIAGGAGLWMYLFKASPAPVATEAAEVITTVVIPAAATATPGVAPTLGNPPTLTPAPTNTQSPAQPTTPATPAGTVTATAKPTWMPCPGSKYSRLYVGDIAYVSFDPPLPNRVRSQPGTSGTYLGMLQPGERMEIIGGPECANQAIWWQVRSLSSSLTGWTAEGDSKDYWLVPAP